MHLRERNQWRFSTPSQESCQRDSGKTEADHRATHLHLNLTIPEGLHQGEIRDAVLRVQAPAKKK